MEKKEMSMEIRLLIAFVLMGLVLFVTPYIYKPPPAPPAPLPAAPSPDKAGDNAAEKAKVDPIKPVAATPSEPAAPAPGQIQAEKEETTIVDTNVYHVVFSNRGAVVRSWILKAYKDRANQPL